MLHLLFQWSEIPLHSVNTDGETVFQQEVLGVLRQYRRVLSVEGEIFADENSQPDSTTQPEGFVMAVPQPNSKSAALEPGSEIHDAEYAHAIGGRRVFLSDYANLPEAEGFNQLTTSMCGTGLCVAVATGVGTSDNCSRVSFPP